MSKGQEKLIKRSAHRFSVKTSNPLEIRSKIITEASFSYNGNFCSVDILRKVDGGYEIIEVKSSTGTTDDTAAEIIGRYGNDLAYQYYVLTGCGLNITKVCLMRLNKNYVRSSEFDLNSFL